MVADLLVPDKLSTVQLLSQGRCWQVDWWLIGFLANEGFPWAVLIWRAMTRGDTRAACGSSGSSCRFWAKIISADPGEQPMLVPSLLFFVSILILVKWRLSSAGRSPWSPVPSLPVIAFPRRSTRSASGSSASSCRLRAKITSADPGERLIPVLRFFFFASILILPLSNSVGTYHAFFPMKFL